MSLQRVYQKIDREGETRRAVPPYDDGVTEIPITIVQRNPKNAQRLEDFCRQTPPNVFPIWLRDEITLTRLQIEYYDAAKGEASDAALKALVDWLAQRPEAQRVVLSQSICSKYDRLYETPLKEKSAALCQALAPLAPSKTPATNDAK